MSVAVTLLCLQQSLALGGLTSAESLKKLSLEQLMDVEVTSVSRTRERLGDAAAAVYVVTNEEIRRSGATTIPDALRGVPGLHVAQRSASSWAVSARGFSSVNSEKLLVLSDTRSLYTPLFSGVFWDVHDLLLQDVERIEVIRGPGAALWGSNAVNGVINIITRNSRDTQGWYAEAVAGTEEELTASARYGGALGSQGSFRVFGKYSERDGTHHPGNNNDDAWDMGRIGVRADWALSATDDLTLQAAAHDGQVGLNAPSIVVIGRPSPPQPLRTDVSGAHALARWTRTLDEDTRWRVRFYYDRSRRDDPSFLDELDTFDLDLQHGFRLAAHEMLVGLNYRQTENRNRGRGVFNLEPASSQDTVISGFIQDQIAVTETVRVTIGTKLEENEYSDFEIQPNLRVAWQVAPSHVLWSAVSRAARVPTRLERDIAVDVSDPAGDPVARLLGNRNVQSEELLAYEAGYRWQPSTQLSLDVAAFYNEYDDLMSLEVGESFLDDRTGQTIIPIFNRNLTQANATGLETLITYAATDFWRLSAHYAFIDLEVDPRGQDINRGRLYEGATPEHQVGVHSLLDLPGGIQLDAHLRYLSDVRSSPDIVDGSGIDGYTELDLRIAWQATEELEVSLVGRNLLDEHHLEFGSPESRGAIERSVYAKLAWGF